MITVIEKQKNIMTIAVCPFFVVVKQTIFGDMKYLFLISKQGYTCYNDNIWIDHCTAVFDCRD